jgi:GTP cyclohydrolase I
VVGISKLARVVEIFAGACRTQEVLTNDIVEAIESHLAPQGVAILIDAEHQCMTTRGVHHRHVSTVTTKFTGVVQVRRGIGSAS